MYKLFSLYETDGIFEYDKMNVKHSDKIFITHWSIAHFVTGYVMSEAGINYLSGFTIHSLYEAITLYSKTIKDKWKKVYIGHKTDSIFNTLGDTIVFMIGMFLAKKNNSILLLLIILLIGLIFYSTPFQNYINDKRMNKFKELYPQLKNVKFHDHTERYNLFFYLWIFVSVTLIIKKKIEKKI